jgi:glycosyltransferase involved in cell wall biosynthesis
LTVAHVRDASIAAIIPLYNGARFIEKSLTSVLEQTRAPEEIIIVDDGSTDDGPEVARRLLGGRNNALLLAQPNAGQSAARNLGASRARSRLLAFLDQDDWWYPEHLAELAEPFAEEHGRPLGWAYSDLDEYDLDGRMVVHRMLTTMRTEHPKRTLGACLGANMYVLPSAALIDRSAFDRVQGFDPRLSGYEDDDLFVRMFLAGYYNVFIPRALSAWRIHGGSASHTPRMAKSALIYAGKLIEQFPDDADGPRHHRRDDIAPRFLRTGLAGFLRGLRAGRPDEVRLGLALVELCRPHLRRRERLALSVLHPLMSLLATLLPKTGRD